MSRHHSSKAEANDRHERDVNGVPESSSVVANPLSPSPLKPISARVSSKGMPGSVADAACEEIDAGLPFIIVRLLNYMLS